MRALAVRRHRQGDGARVARVEIFQKALDRSALSRRIPSLENGQHALPGLGQMALELDQLDLQGPQVLFIVLGL